MRRSQRLIAAAILISLSSALAGCSSMNGFDPTDMLDFLDTKKKLPGVRKPVFPEGVPGLEQGVPRDLYKGANQQQVEDPTAQVAAVPAAPPPEEPKSMRGARPNGGAAAATNPAAEEEGSTAAAPPPPKRKRIVRRRSITVPPPDKPAVQPAAPAPSTQQSANPFPAPLPSGSFSR